MYWYTLNIIQTWSYLRFCFKRNDGNWMILDPTSSVPTKDKRLLWVWAGLALTCDPIYSALYSASACCTPCILLNFIITPECSQKPFDIITLDHLYHNITNITSHGTQVHCVTVTSLYIDWTLYNYIWLHCITLRDIWLHCITLHYFWLHQIAFCQVELGSPFRWQGPPPTGSIR